MVPLKACLNTFQMNTNVMGFQWSRKITNIFCILIFVTKVDLRTLIYIYWATRGRKTEHIHQLQY
jgi:hypothetical protein